MNGRDLSQDHGYPVRAIVPGTAGSNNTAFAATDDRSLDRISVIGLSPTAYNALDNLHPEPAGGGAIASSSTTLSSSTGSSGTSSGSTASRGTSSGGHSGK